MKLPSSSNDAFNVVAIGSWNPAIFSPEWAKEHLADDKTRDVILAIPMPMGSVPPRLTVDGVNLYPSPTLLMADCVEYGDVSIDACARKLQMLSELLPHTPVSAIGVNFRFVGDLDDNEILAALFAFGDAGRISTRFVASGSMIKRAFKLSDGTVLNLTLDTFSDGLRVEFNFHTDVRKMADLVAKTSGQQIRAARDIAQNFLRDVYGIELSA